MKCSCDSTANETISNCKEQTLTSHLICHSSPNRHSPWSAHLRSRTAYRPACRRGPSGRSCQTPQFPRVCARPFPAPSPFSRPGTTEQCRNNESNIYKLNSGCDFRETIIWSTDWLTLCLSCWVASTLPMRDQVDEPGLVFRALTTTTHYSPGINTQSQIIDHWNVGQSDRLKTKKYDKPISYWI